MVALILCAGKGKRLQSAIKTNKCMVSVLGKPLVERTVKAMAGIKVISEIIIVIGYMGDDIKRYLGSSYHGKDIKYVVQHELNGVVDAIQCARKKIGENDFFLLLGDEYLENPRYNEMISEFLKSGYFCYLGVVPVCDRSLIKKTYTFSFDSELNVCSLIEKPQKPFNNYMGTGNIIFNNSILNYIDRTPINPIRGERELVDLIQLTIYDGKKVGFFEISNRYINLNKADELYEINKINREQAAANLSNSIF
jgi:dTDP-glucose pyrophosphorylase